MKSTKLKRTVSVILISIVSLMLVMGGIMIIIKSEELVQTMSKAGLDKHIQFLGITELIIVALLFIPKTNRVGFFLATSYLGGALSVELANNNPPMAFVLLILLWTGAFLKDRHLFFTTAAN